MNGNRFITYLTLLVLAGMAIILMFNISNLFTGSVNERYLSYNGVRGVAVEYKQKLWTLNFEQQNQLIDWINRAIPIGKLGKPERGGVPYNRIVVYRFNAPDLFITPIGYDGDNLVLEAKEWNPSGYLLDVSRGSLDTLLQSTYDS